MMIINFVMDRAENQGMLNTPLPAIDEPEGDYVPIRQSYIVDAHVHLFPNNLFTPIRQWFEIHGWPIRYQLSSEDIIQFLNSHGIDHIVALHYAHKPGIAWKLNSYMAEISRIHPQVSGMATVYPGEQDAVAILEQAFNDGLAGVKLHNHVQCFDINSPAMDEIYDICGRTRKPLIMHVGREPKSPAYRCDPYELCQADMVERVLRDYPQLKVCVPHLGADEFDAYQRMLERYDNLWLDTTMMLADYLPMDYSPRLGDMRTDRIMYGTDFPNLPYAWDREIKKLVDQDLPQSDLTKILGSNAVEFYQIDRRK
ncbi:MAG: amidohydrolase family protein [Desulfobacterales bacterium]|nr:amidohydrolase family protein [Desulfobacterales bacterium]